MRTLLNAILFAVGVTLIILLSNSASAMTKIAIIDTGFSKTGNAADSKLCSRGHIDYATRTRTVGSDFIGHGTVIANLIAERAGNKKYCFLIYKIPLTTPGSTTITHAVKTAVYNKAKYINISLGTYRQSLELQSALNRAASKGVKVFIAAGNSGINLNVTCTDYPVCLKLRKNIYIVGATNRYNEPEKYSNHGVKVNVWDFGTFKGMRGTSFASPRALVRDFMEPK